MQFNLVSEPKPDKESNYYHVKSNHCAANNPKELCQEVAMYSVCVQCRQHYESSQQYNKA